MHGLNAWILIHDCVVQVQLLKYLYVCASTGIESAMSLASVSACVHAKHGYSRMGCTCLPVQVPERERVTGCVGGCPTYECSVFMLV